MNSIAGRITTKSNRQKMDTPFLAKVQYRFPEGQFGVTDPTPGNQHQSKN